MDGLTNRHEFIGQESLKEYMYMVYFVLTLKLLPLRLKKMKKSTRAKNMTSTVGAYLEHITDFYWVSS